MILFNNAAMNALNKNLDGLWAREQVISENLANYETPGYQRKYVTFEQELLNKLSKKGTSFAQRSEEIADIVPEEHTTVSAGLREDGNNVDIEVENIEMARTQLNYSFTVQNLDDYFSRLRTAITGS